jgi:hypothetical protein
VGALFLTIETCPDRVLGFPTESSAAKRYGDEREKTTTNGGTAYFNNNPSIECGGAQVEKALPQKRPIKSA